MRRSKKDAVIRDAPDRLIYDTTQDEARPIRGRPYTTKVLMRRFRWGPLWLLTSTSAVDLETGGPSRRRRPGHDTGVRLRSASRAVAEPN